MGARKPERSTKHFEKRDLSVGWKTSVVFRSSKTHIQMDVVQVFVGIPWFSNKSGRLRRLEHHAVASPLQTTQCRGRIREIRFEERSRVHPRKLYIQMRRRLAVPTPVGRNVRRKAGERCITSWRVTARLDRMRLLCLSRLATLSSHGEGTQESTRQGLQQGERKKYTSSHSGRKGRFRRSHAVCFRRCPTHPWQ